jgi:hypothetical protein
VLLLALAFHVTLEDPRHGRARSLAAVVSPGQEGTWQGTQPKKYPLPALEKSFRHFQSFTCFWLLIFEKPGERYLRAENTSIPPA